MVLWKMSSLQILRARARARATKLPSSSSLLHTSSKLTTPSLYTQLIIIPFRHFCSSSNNNTSLPRIYTAVKEEKKKLVPKKKVYISDTIDLEKVDSFFKVVIGMGVTSRINQVNAVYYGVSVMHHDNQKTIEEELNRLNKEVAFRDTVRKVISEVLAGVEMRPLGEEPTAKWILENRIQTTDELAWDIVVSLLDINRVTKEEMAKISEKGIKNVLWIVIKKEGLGVTDMQGINLCQGSFVGFVVSRSDFWQASWV